MDGMPEYVVNVSAAASWADVIAAFNRDFIRPICGGEWNGNLDALNDYLSWPNDQPYRLVLRGWSDCATVVNQHAAHGGRPVLDVVDEILSDNPQAVVVRS